MKASSVKYIGIHCTAGFSSPEKVQAYFLRSKSKGGRGWKTGGYHIIVGLDGVPVQMYPFSRVTNGVRGFNHETIHISYVGGIEKRGRRYFAKDTRTEAQKEGIKKSIQKALDWLTSKGVDVSTGIQVVGHRDFSKDSNKDGVIQSWERIKECPSMDAIEEYIEFSSPDMCGLLPN